MKNYSIILFLLISVVSCQKHREKTLINTPIISQEKMIAILIDMHLLEASTLQIALDDSLVSPKAYNGYLAIFQKHQVSRQEFDSAISYYSANAHKMERIMQAVVDSLTIRNNL